MEKPLWMDEFIDVVTAELECFSQVFNKVPKITRISFDVIRDQEGEDYCVILVLDQMFSGRMLPDKKQSGYDPHPEIPPKVIQFTVNMIVVKFDFTMKMEPSNFRIGEGISIYMDKMMAAQPIIEKGVGIENEVYKELEKIGFIKLK